MGAFEHVSQFRPYQIYEGVIARAVEGDPIGMAVVEFSPGSGTRAHSHDFEEMGLILQGSVNMTVGGETRTLEAGDTFLIPLKAVHQVTSGTAGATLIAVSPTRHDWKTRPRLEPRRGNWPPE